jgi:ectoine hydroxylase-related dioxygenase (phytanoyl-CoA dioxygenase family)
MTSDDRPSTRLAARSRAGRDTLKKNVESELDRREQLRKADIDVAVAAGTVRLTGSVPSEELRESAATIARAVEGVKAVSNDLRIERFAHKLVAASGSSPGGRGTLFREFLCKAASSRKRPRLTSGRPTASATGQASIVNAGAGRAGVPPVLVSVPIETAAGAQYEDLVQLERHPLSQGFEWQPARGPLRHLSAAQARAYDEKGYFVLEDAFDAATLARIVAAIDPLEEEVEELLRTREGGRIFIARAGEITFSPHLVARSAFLRGICSGPPFTDLAHDLIGPDVRLYWDQAVYKKPGTEADFPWHQDNGYTYVEPQQYLTCWVALSDVDESNGCPWVVPGVHRRGTLRHRMTELGWRCLERAAAAAAVPARAGSIVVLSSLTPHRTGPNRTAHTRKAYIVQYAPDGARRVEIDRETGARRSFPCDAAGRQFQVLVGGRLPP